MVVDGRDASPILLCCVELLPDGEDAAGVVEAVWPGGVAVAPEFCEISTEHPHNIMTMTRNKRGDLFFIIEGFTYL